ncbi:MAG TPA: YciI family protein [Casimicrobiaceae bacterium]|nr:YciI family protein [Casimicrobiaceae bacterium]
MEYALLITEPPGQRQSRSESEGHAVYDRMLHYADDLKSRGVLRLAQSLKTDTTGVRVKVRDGRRTLLDGPFSEAKEMIGGFFIVDCESRDEAIAIASAMPAAEWATVEVRELGPCFA